MSIPKNHVVPGGEPCTVKLSDTVEMTKFSVAPADNNVWLLTDAHGSVLIDAANDADRITEVIGDRTVSTIITTHRHPDHLQALAAVAERTGAQLVCGTPDKEAIDGATGTTSDPVWTGDTIALPGGETLEVIGIVGHTPGAITLVYRPDAGPAHLFVGDSLFPGGVGKTWSEADFFTLMDEVETKIFGAFDDETCFHPGHGDDSTLGAERPALTEWRTRGW